MIGENLSDAAGYIHHKLRSTGGQSRPTNRTVGSYTRRRPAGYGGSQPTGAPTPSPTQRHDSRGWGEAPLAVITKIGHDLRGGDIALERKVVDQHLEESLEALAVEQLGVLLYHCDDLSRSVDELADTLVAIVECGLVQRIGAANWSPDRLSSLAAAVEQRGHQLATSYHLSLAEPNPALLNPGNLAADPAVLAVIRQRELPLISWSAQAGGFFAREPGATGGCKDPFNTPTSRARRERCRVLAQPLGARPETVALAWTLHQPATSVTIGPRSIEQLERSFEALALSLNDHDLAWLHSGE